MSTLSRIRLLPCLCIPKTSLLQKWGQVMKKSTIGAVLLLSGLSFFASQAFAVTMTVPAWGGWNGNDSCWQIGQNATLDASACSPDALHFYRVPLPLPTTATSIIGGFTAHDRTQFGCGTSTGACGTVFVVTSDNNVASFSNTVCRVGQTYALKTLSTASVPTGAHAMMQLTADFPPPGSSCEQVSFSQVRYTY